MSTKQLCPHCRTTAGVTRTRRGELRCKLCAGPRIVVADANLVLSGNEVPLLVAARKAGRSSWLWAGASLLLAMMGAFSLLVITGALLVLNGVSIEPSALVTALLLVFGSVPFAGAYWAWRKSRVSRRAADAALHEAQLRAAGDVLRGSQRELTAENLAELLELPLPMTEGLLAELNVDDSVTSHVTDDGEITYRIAPLRTRIDELDAGDLASAEYDALQDASGRVPLAEDEPSETNTARPRSTR